MKARRLLPAALALGACMVLPGCAGSSHSSAADSYIAQAQDSEEREGLEQARDDIDAEMQAQADDLDRQIDRLRKENGKLRAELADRGEKPPN